MKQSISKLFSIKAIIFVCSYLMLLSFTAYGRVNNGDVNSLKPHAAVSSVSPANNATGVAINSSITATFTNKMNPATITTATFTVSTGGSNIAGAVTYSGTTATFTPSSNLSYNTTYTATIRGVKVAEGNAVGLDRALDNVSDKKDKKDKRDVEDSERDEMSRNYTWTFTTGAAPDITPPTVSSVSPTNDTTGVAINSSITATFSEVMDAATINATTFTIIGVTGTVTYSGTTATFTPSSNLSYRTIYTGTITTGVKDAAGNPMVSSYTWSFTTGAAPDTTPPTVSHTASGTYTYDSGTGVLTMNWTSSDFTCNGPSVGSGNTSTAIVTATTMTGVGQDSNNNYFTWTRASGTTGDIVGTWTTTDSTTGNSYMLTFNTNGTMSVVGNIIQCGGTNGGQQPLDTYAYSGHLMNMNHTTAAYYGYISVYDPNHEVSSVTVSGPGISGSINLSFNAAYNNWYLDSGGVSGMGNQGVNLGVTPPAPPLVYNVTITKTDSTVVTKQATIQSFVDQFASNLSPSGGQSVSTGPVFSWTVVVGGYTYGVHVDEFYGNHVWYGGNVTQTSTTYAGPALTQGTLYAYAVEVRDSNSNFSAWPETFTYQIVTGPFDGTYMGTWSLTCPVCGDTAAGTFSATVTNGAFTSCPTITSGTHGIVCFSGTVSSSGSITGTGVAPVQCPNSVSSFTGQITMNSSGVADMTMQYSRPSDPAGCEAEYGTMTATR